jgi:hypothetical protein
MSHTANQQHDYQAPSTRGAFDPRCGRARVRRTALVVVALLSTGVLVAACGGGSSPSAPQRGSTAGPSNSALAFVNCMRTHGEPNMPDPVINGASVQITITPGLDPNSPQFTAANKACADLLPNDGVGTQATITRADQADYLKAAACMRSHGIPDFPDPVFQHNNVTFSTPGSSIDTNSPQYKSALTTCEKLIPAGLPYSSPGGG